jgi:hypothetical protein
LVAKEVGSVGDLPEFWLHCFCLCCRW